MRKLLFIVLLVALVAVPMSAFAQATATREIPQVIPVVFNAALAPSTTSPGFGIPGFYGQLNRCFAGGGAIAQSGIAGIPTTAPAPPDANTLFLGGEPVQWVGNVLCIDPGALSSFITCANLPAGYVSAGNPVIQRIQMTKTIPAYLKCFDVYPGASYTRTVTSNPSLTPFRLWFPVKFSPPSTTFTLIIRWVCPVVPAAGGRTVNLVRTNTIKFHVNVTPALLRGVLLAEWAEPLGTAEIPCITDLSVLLTLLARADAVAGAGADPVAVGNALLALEDALFAAVIPLNGIFINAAGALVPPYGALFGQTGAGPLAPGAGFAGGPGIIDTFENPCYCKLIADLEYIRSFLPAGAPGRAGSSKPRG